MTLGYNKQEDDDTISASVQNSNENQESQKNDEIEADEKDELLEQAPTKEAHAKIGERKDSDV